MVREIRKKEISKFVDFADNIYHDDKYYVPLLKKDLKKTIKKLVIDKKTYKAICTFDEKGRITGRILITVKPNKQLKTEKCGYFSHLEVIDNQSIFNELLDFSISELKQMGADYIVGTFFPHDPDNRRGVLYEGFNSTPMLFTSYNPRYYVDCFENYGFKKLTDAYEYEYEEKQEIIEKIKHTAEKSIEENDFHISKLDYSNIKRDIRDVHEIMEIASTQINFENVLSVEELERVFKKWKAFISPDYAFIARKNSDDRPIGFTLSMPDYNEIIQKTKGKMGIKGMITFLSHRNRTSGLRAILQYVIPDYQHKGVSKALYYETKKSVDKNHIKRICLGTIMEKNLNSNNAILSIGGKLEKIYRIYYKEI